jgi:uncharacterized membrane protein SpoIIM required for sporulation/ABC-type transport system involved in multi-copper enzyme maturation permease subunit
MRAKLAPVWLLAQRELRDQFRDWRILFPLIVLTLLFPPLMNSFAGQAVDFMNQYGGNLILDRLVPFSILIIGFFPVTISLVVALESFVGEKERGTIEPLLGTPLLDWQLYLGKLLVGVIFPLAASYLAIALYILMVSRQNLNLPPLDQILQLLVLTASHAILMVSGAIAISTQATSVRAANLMASFIVLPVAFLIQGESVLLFWGNGDILWMAVAAVLILSVLLMRVGIAHFQREYLLGREIDSFNVKWMWKAFVESFVGDVHSVLAWYQIQVGAALRRLRVPLLLILVATILGSVISFQWASSAASGYFSDVPQEEVEKILHGMSMGTALSSLGREDVGFSFIFLHNLRSIFFMFLFGLFSLGVLGELAFALNIGFAGGVLGVFDLMGLPVWELFMAGVLPHGIFEIPAIIFAGASILYFGAVLVTPNPSRTMGAVLISVIADWSKIFIGLIVPLLALAAFVEVNITPQILGLMVP